VEVTLEFFEFGDGSGGLFTEAVDLLSPFLGVEGAIGVFSLLVCVPLLEPGGDVLVERGTVHGTSLEGSEGS